MDNINTSYNIIANELFNISPKEYIRIYDIESNMYIYSAFMEDLRSSNISILLEYNTVRRKLSLIVNNLIIHSRVFSSIPSNINNLYKIISV